MAEAATEGNLSRTFEVKPGGQLIVEAEDGDIEVTTSAGNQVAVEVLRRAEAEDEETEREILENHLVTFRQDGDTVTIRGERKKRGFWNLLRNVRFQVHYVISIPREFDAELRTSDGNVSIRDLVGDLAMKSSDGNLKIGNVRGKVQGKTSDGDITVGKCIGPMELQTSDGAIRIDRAEGEISARTSDGDIHVQEIFGRLEAGTSDGDIEATFAAPPTGDCRLTTSDGNISVRLAETAGVDLDIRTSDGQIVSDFPVMVQGKLSDDTLIGTINGGGYRLLVKTSDGDVVLKKL